MPGSATYATEVHARQRVVIIYVIVNLRDTIVLRAGADQTENQSS